jgi:hypothetical protein
LVKKNELKEIVRRHNNVKNELESSFWKNLIFKVYNFEFSNYLDLKDVNRIERTVLHHEWDFPQEKSIAQWNSVVRFHSR